MSDLVTVGISDMKIVKGPDVLVTYALGSCVGICLYDPILQYAALAHIMLPNALPNVAMENPMKCADTCLPIALDQMLRKGCSKSRVTAKIIGGARMFDVIGDSGLGSIGDRNIQSVKDALRKLGVRIIAEDTGKNYGRTVYFYAENGKVEVKACTHGVSVL